MTMSKWIEELPEELSDKAAACLAVLRMLRQVVIGYSGGTDSTLLTALALEALGRQNVIAAMATGPIFPSLEQQLGQRVAQKMGAELVTFDVRPMHDAVFVANPPDRCQHCKKMIFHIIRDLAGSRGVDTICSGTNADDPGDYRPGLQAEKELRVRQPLLEAGLTKADIRTISRAMGLETADLPAQACLASRIPYGQKITADKLGRIDRIEQRLRELGLGQVRLRDHDPIARVEFAPDMLPEAVRYAAEIIAAAKAEGYRYVTLDLEGYRTGSLNEELPAR
jgi:uncharacterized protein